MIQVIDGTGNSALTKYRSPGRLN